MSLPVASPRPSARGSYRFWLVLAGAWALVGVTALHLLARFNAQALDVSTLFSADNLYLPALYRDLFEDGGRWAGWRLTPAPYFFPDMGLYFALDALTGPALHALIAYAIAQCLVLGLAAQFLARTAAPRQTSAQAQVLAVGVVAALLLACAEGRLELMQYAALSATHFSLVPLVTVALALLLRAVRDRSRVSVGGLALLCGMATASDSLFVVTFTVPALLCLGGLAWLARPGIPWRWVGSIAGLVLLATVVGSRVPRWVSPWRTAGFTRMRLTEASDTLGRLAEALREQYQASPAVGMTWLLLVLLALGTVVFRRAWATPDSDRWGLYALCLFTVLTLGTTTGAVVLTGQFENKGNFRYLLVPALLPFLQLAFLPGLLQRHQTRQALCAGALGLVTVAAASAVLRHPWSTEGPLSTGFHPPLVECLDQRRASQDLGWGVANYWVARLVTTFSRTGLRVNQVLPDGSLYHWINNLDWYLERRGENSDYTFIITQGLAPDAITAKYGAPRDVLHCDAFDVFLYGKDLDAPMRAGFAAETAERDGTRAGISPTKHARPD